MKKQFRLMLFNSSIEVVNSLIIGAAAANGGSEEIDINKLKVMGEGMVKQFPALTNGCDISFELVGENILAIDAKINDNWLPIAVIEETEVFELSANEKEAVI